MNKISHIELGRPARPGQLILERRFLLAGKLIPELKKLSMLLDLGCGNGAQTIYFASTVKRLIGVDIVPIDRAESSVGGKHFDFIRSFAESLPFGGGSFDIVTSFEVLEHLQDDRAAVKEVYRVLGKQGYFLFSVPNKWWIFESHGASIAGLNWLPWNRIPFVGWLPGFLHRRIARARIYTMKKAIDLAESAGFEVVDKGYITAPLDVLPEGRLRRLLRKAVFRGVQTRSPFLAVNLFVLCRKNA